MTMPEPGWDLYKTFLATLRGGSLSAAARELGLTQPTVGRQIDALEASLGVGLFTRAPSGLVPTAAALDLATHAEAMESASAAALRAASGAADPERGTVRLTSSEVVGAEVLPAILVGFRELHPHIALELVTSNRTEDLLRRDADIAVRMVRPTQEALVARRIGTLGIGLYAHKRYAERFGLPADLEALTRHHIIGFDRDASSVRQVRIDGLALSRDLFDYRCDNDLAQLAALRAGLGIGGCMHRLARHQPDLMPVLAGRLEFPLDVWLVMHEDQRANRRIRLLFDHLAGALDQFVNGA